MRERKEGKDEISVKVKDGESEWVVMIVMIVIKNTSRWFMENEREERGAEKESKNHN